jgi:hypothetical protein
MRLWLDWFVSPPDALYQVTCRKCEQKLIQFLPGNPGKIHGRSKRGGNMGVVTTKEYVCDLCGKEVPKGVTPHVGTLKVRKQGSRGLGREVTIVAHGPCIDQLSGTATNGHSANGRGAAKARKAPAKAKAKPKVQPKIKASIS